MRESAAPRNTAPRLPERGPPGLQSPRLRREVANGELWHLKTTEKSRCTSGAAGNAGATPRRPVPVPVPVPVPSDRAGGRTLRGIALSSRERGRVAQTTKTTPRQVPEEVSRSLAFSV